MDGKSKTLALMLLFLFIASLLAIPQNVKALPEPTPNAAITLTAIEVTDTTVTLSWTSDQGTPFNGRPYFNNYVVRMSTKALNNEYPYSVANYIDIWTTTDVLNTTTTVANLSSSTTYYFYILASDYLGGAFSNIVKVQTKPNSTLPSTNNSAPAIEWQNQYGNEGTHDNRTESVSNLIQTSDGGYAFLDLGWGHSMTLQPATLYKVNSSGGIQWQEAIGNMFSPEVYQRAGLLGKSLVQTSDGGFEMSGYWSNYPGSESVPTIVKTDQNGNIQWIENYSTAEPPSITNAFTIIQTSDGGFAHILQSGTLVKTNSNNQTQWTKVFTIPDPLSPKNNFRPELFSLVETSDGAIAVLGVANPDYGINVWGSVFLAKTEPFLPIPTPTMLPTSIPTTPSIGSSIVQLTFPLIAVIILAGMTTYILLYRRHRKTAVPKNLGKA